MILDGGARAYIKYEVISKDHIHSITTQVRLTNKHILIRELGRMPLNFV